MELISKIKLYTILLAIFVIPLIFNPYFTDIFPAIKGLSIIFFASLLLLIWGIESFITKKFVVRVSWVNTFVLLLFGSVVISFVANTSIVSSWFGITTPPGTNVSVFGINGTLGSGVLVFTSLVILYFVISSAIDSEQKVKSILRTVGVSGSVLVIATLLRYALPNVTFNNVFDIVFKGYSSSSNLFPSLYPTQNFSPLGEYYLVPLFLLIGILCTLYILLTDQKDKNSKPFLVYMGYVNLAILSCGFAIITWGNVFSWVMYAMAIISIGLVLRRNTKSLVKSKVVVKDNRSMYIGIVVIAAILGFILVKVLDMQQVSSPIVPLDASWSITFASWSNGANVGVGESLRNSFFGIGPENFGIAYLRNKPLAINNSNLIFENLSHSGNFVLELITQYGLLGLIIVIFITFKIFRFFFNNRDEEDENRYFFMILFLVMGIALFFFPLNAVMLFMYFLVFALFSFVTAESNSLRSLVIAVKGSSQNGMMFSSRSLGEKSPERNLSHGIFALFTVIIFAGVSFFGYNFFMSQFYFSRANRNNTSVSNDQIYTKVLQDYVRAVQHFDQVDAYYNRLGNISLQRLLVAADQISQRIQTDQAKNKENPSAVTITQQETTLLESLAVQSRTSIERAVILNPLNFENYLLGSNLYLWLTKNSPKEQAQTNLNTATSYINSAYILNPQNPSIHVVASDVYLLANDSGRVLNLLGEAVIRLPSPALVKTLKPEIQELILNYVIRTYIRAAQVFRDNKQYDNAVNAIKIAQKNYVSPDAPLYKELDDLIKQVEEEKGKDTTVTPTPTVTPTTTIVPTTVITTTKKK